MKAPNRLPAVGERYAWDQARGLRIDGTAISAVPLASPNVVAARRGVPAGFVLREDPICADERLVLGAVITGRIGIDEVDDVLCEPSHRAIVEALRPTGFNDAEIWDRGGVIKICHDAGLPPEITGGHRAGREVGYLAAVKRNAPDRDGAIAAAKRLRAVDW